MRALAFALVVAMSTTHAGPGMDSSRAERSQPEYAAPDSERYILTGAFCNPEWWRNAAGRIEAAHFRDKRHRAIARGLLELIEEGRPLEVTVLATSLNADGSLEDAGGLDYVGGFDDGSALADEVLDSHLADVRNEALRRGIHNEGGMLQLESGSVERSPTEILTDARERLERLALLTTNGVGPPGRSGADVLADPDAQTCEVPIAAPFMWRQRSTVFSSREKMGKTSIMAAAVAAITRGDRFIGLPTVRGTVAWWAGITESKPADVARLVKSFGGDVSRLYLIEAPGEPFALLEHALRAWRPDALVVDSLAALVSGLELDSGDAGGWTAVMSRINRLAVDFNCAAAAIHHGNKATGEYRDSTAIGASADVLIAMSEGAVEGERKLKATARWAIPPMTVRLIQPDHGNAHFEQVGSGVSVDARVLHFIEAKPGCSTRAVRDGVRGKAAEIDEVLRRLQAAGHIEDRGGSSGRRFHVVTEQTELGGAE